MKQIQKDRLLKIVNSFNNKRILVIGDVMLDEYVWGKVRRISPEAPVPVVDVQDRTFMAGGAANTGSNIASLGGKVELIGVIGDDQQAKLLKQKLKSLHIGGEGLVIDFKNPTITKTRIIANKQHVVRVDVEKREPLGVELEDQILKQVEQQLSNADVVVISDYGKKVISERVSQSVIESSRKLDLPVIVDPKGMDYTKYRYATIITPNVLEAELALKCEINNDEQVQKAGEDLNRLIQSKAILLTRGDKGMTLFRQGEVPITVSAVARTLYDVTGAGDTVVGTLAMALAAGATLEEGVILANLAAGLVVEKLGTATVTQKELIHSFSDQ